MKTIRLGRTELLVSEIGFGGIPIMALSLEQAVKVVQRCLELGITFFDTANMYGDSEEKLGAALSSVRNQVIIATKTTDRTREGAAEHLRLSLNRLSVDRIDLYQLHNVSSRAEMEAVFSPGGAWEAVEAARHEGTIRDVGVTSHDIETAKELCKTDKFATLQFPFNFIESEPTEVLFPLARKHDMGIIAMKPLGGGFLDRADLCFKFLQQHPDVVPIPGIQSIAEIEEIVELYHTRPPLTATDHTDIETHRRTLGKKFCHRCGYCLPCEQGVKIPAVMGFRSVVFRVKPKEAIRLAGEWMQTAELCNECGECMERCPYSLPIPEMVQDHGEMYRQYVAEYGEA